MKRSERLLLSAILVFAALAPAALGEPDNGEGWIELFNGKDLTGWTPKFSGCKPGENYRNTFLVEGGVLKVSYNDYDAFSNRYGHLFFNKPFSRYHLQLEYRFVGSKLPDSPWWTQLNSGVMIHADGPESMPLIPDPMSAEVDLLDHFPTSVECQLLGAPQQGKMDVPTANACQIRTVIDHDGGRAEERSIYSSSEGHPAGVWVTLDVIVDGSHEVIHRISGREVLRYSNLRRAGSMEPLASGHIAIQAESQPVEFRNIRLRELP